MTYLYIRILAIKQVCDRQWLVEQITDSPLPTFIRVNLIYWRSIFV